MFIGYIVSILIGLSIYFLMAKCVFWQRLIISILFFIILSIIWTLVVIKMAAAPMNGKKYTLEQWKESIGNKEK